MTQVAEAYIHLKRTRSSFEHLLMLRERLAEASVIAVPDRFPRETIISVRVAEGSVKAWATLAVPLLTTYGLIADYKSFKESIPELVRDARDIGGSIATAFLKSIDDPEARVFRIERRTKALGKMQRISRRREFLERNKADAPSSLVAQIEAEIEGMIKELLKDVDPSEHDAVRKLLGQPNSPPVPTQGSDRVAIVPRQTQGSMLEPNVSELEISKSTTALFCLADWNGSISQTKLLRSVPPLFAIADKVLPSNPVGGERNRLQP